MPRYKKYDFDTSTSYLSAVSSGQNLINQLKMAEGKNFVADELIRWKSYL